MKRVRQTTASLTGTGGIVSTILGIEAFNGEALSDEFSLSAMCLAVGGQIAYKAIEALRDFLSARPALGSTIRDITADGRITDEERQQLRAVLDDSDHDERYNA